MIRTLHIRTFLIFLWVCTSVYSISFAQSRKNSDSYTDDTTKVSNLNLLSKNTFNSDPQKAIVYSNQALALADKIDMKSGSALALKNLGIAYYIQANYAEALTFFRRSLDLYRSIGDELGEANLLSNLGGVYFNLGDDVRALDNHLKSLKISEKLNNKFRITTSLINIGAVYFNKPQTHIKALEYYLRALPLSEELGDNEVTGTATVNLGEIYLETGQDSLALYYFQKSLKAYEGSPNIPYSLNSIAKVLLKRKDYEGAIAYHQKALKVAENLNGQLDVAQSHIGLGNTYFKQGKLKDASSSYQKAENIASRINALYELKNAYEGLSKSYAEIPDFEKAYRYANLLIGMKDSLFYNVETGKQLSGLQFEFDMQKKQSEIDRLLKNRALQQLELKRRQFTENSLIAGLIVVALFGFVLLRNYRIKAKTNKLLDKQKAEIELLLSNMLPEVVAKELRNDGFATPRFYESVSVLFSDFKNFTQMADALSPQEVVLELNSCFMAFDDIIERNNLEKIKTIGDAYMCAGGIPTVNEEHALNIVNASLEIQEFMRVRNKEKIELGQTPWELRIGIHTGPVVAGVVGKKKYAYDIWGSTVNTASRMESNGEPGRVNISATIYELIKDHYFCTYRGKVLAKNVGEIDMYFVDSPRSQHTELKQAHAEESAQSQKPAAV